MFGWFRKRRGSSPVGPPALHLPFASNGAAFEYACKYMQTELQAGTMLPAIVLDASIEAGTRMSVSRDSHGIQTAMLKVCSRDGGFLIVAQSSGSLGPALKPGDFVAWQALKFMPEFAKEMGDDRSGWIGMILGTLKPEWRPEGWLVEERFR